MTITDIAEPTRDVELGTQVDEQQDIEVKETDKSFFESYVGIVDGESNGDEGDEAMQQQQQLSSINTHEDPEQQPSSSRNDIEDDEEEIPPRPYLLRIRDELLLIGHRCPMILKPFAWLVEIVVMIISILYAYILLIIGLFFLGPLFMYAATVLDRERTILMEKYI